MIPVRNLYYMLLYAWGYFRSSEVQDVGQDESPDLPNLLAKVLNDRTHRLLRKGLDQGYVSTVEETRSPRGKLKLDAMAKRQTLLRGVAVCEVDERTPDILHNQILRETLLRLGACTDVEKDLRNELRATASRMRVVSRVHLTSGLFHRVQLSRNTAQYGLLMRICELVFESLMPDEVGQGSRFANILKDKTRMSAVFEEFLRKFYDRELASYRAGSETMKWSAAADSTSDLAHLPEMRTDITLRSSERLIVIDAKYTPRFFAKPRYAEKTNAKKLRSGHLYQLMTYLAHARVHEPSRAVSGMLIYPAVGESWELRYSLLGTPVCLATVDLGGGWTSIHQRLIHLATAKDDHRSLLKPASYVLPG